MKVLHCVPSLTGGGAERQLTYLAKALVQIGCDVHVAYVHGGPNLQRLETSGATLHRIAAFGNHDPQILWRLFSTIRKIDPDIVQCWLLQMEVLGGLASLLTRTPWVFSERSCEDAYPPSLKTWLRTRMGLLATAIVANSEGGERYWLAQGQERRRCHIIRNGLPLDEIGKAPMATVEEAGVTAGEPLVLYAGRFGLEKNLEALLRAIGLVATSHPARTIFCGDGPLRNQIENLVRQNGLDQRVRILGYASNLWSLMKRANVVASVSRFEGTPNVVLEGMACRCPLVVSDIPAHRELLDEEAAILVDPRDPRRIADAIIDVIDNPERAAQRAQVAYERVQRYSLPAIARQYADLYKELALTGGRQLTRVAS